LDSPNASLVHFYLKKLVISFRTRGDITWQESSQCVTESRLPVQTRRLSIVRDVRRQPDMPSVRRERRAAFCGQQKPASKYTTIQSRLSSQFYNQPAEIPSLPYLSQRRGNPHVIHLLAVVVVKDAVRYHVFTSSFAEKTTAFNGKYLVHIKTASH
jgi:hypothetical protein